MIKHGKAPYYECSSLGDKRFSAFHATIYGRTIERIYQAAKIFEDGTTGLSIKAAKGRKPVNIKEVSKLYGELWDTYIKENPHLVAILKMQVGLCDTFGQPGHACQATELWRIRNEYIDEENRRRIFDASE